MFKIEPPRINNASDYKVLRELESRVNRMLTNKGCFSEEFIKKLEELHTAIGRVRVHL
jgi:hypothetical protein